LEETPSTLLHMDKDVHTPARAHAHTHTHSSKQHKVGFHNLEFELQTPHRRRLPRGERRRRAAYGQGRAHTHAHTHTRTHTPPEATQIPVRSSNPESRTTHAPHREAFTCWKTAPTRCCTWTSWCRQARARAHWRWVVRGAVPRARCVCVSVLIVDDDDIDDVTIADLRSKGIRLVNQLPGCVL
jgi:hypothetical protein